MFYGGSCIPVRVCNRDQSKMTCAKPWACIVPGIIVALSFASLLQEQLLFVFPDLWGCHLHSWQPVGFMWPREVFGQTNTMFQKWFRICCQNLRIRFLQDSLGFWLYLKTESLATHCLPLLSHRASSQQELAASFTQKRIHWALFLSDVPACPPWVSEVLTLFSLDIRLNLGRIFCVRNWKLGSLHKLWDVCGSSLRRKIPDSSEYRAIACLREDCFSSWDCSHSSI